jgi:hypothetical protein
MPGRFTRRLAETGGEYSGLRYTIGPRFQDRMTASNSGRKSACNNMPSGAGYDVGQVYFTCVTPLGNDPFSEMILD